MMRHLASFFVGFCVMFTITRTIRDIYNEYNY